MRLYKSCEPSAKGQVISTIKYLKLIIGFIGIPDWCTGGEKIIENLLESLIWFPKGKKKRVLGIKEYFSWFFTSLVFPPWAVGNNESVHWKIWMNVVQNYLTCIRVWSVRISQYVRNFVCIRIGVVGYWVHGWDTEGLSRYLHELFFTQSS